MLEERALLGLYLLLYQPVQYKLVSPVELLVRHLLTLCMLEAQALLGLYLPLYQPVRYKLVALVELLVLPCYCCFFQTDSDLFYFLLLMFPYLEVILEKMG